MTPVSSDAQDRNSNDANPFGATTVVTGTPVVGGLAYGPIIRPGTRPGVDGIDSTPVAEGLRAAEVQRFTSAANVVAARLSDRASHSSGVAAEVLTATAGLARDRGWIAAATKSMDQGVPAPLAATAATEQFVEMFTKLGGLMAERVTDLKDVRDRVVAELLGLPEPGIPNPEEPSILLADDLAPADTAGLDPTRVIGLAMRLGGPSSHTAIIARQLAIPCIVAVPGLDDIATGTMGYVDGDAGTIGESPDADRIAQAVVQARAKAEQIALWRGPGHTADGHAVAILANVADGVSARSGAQAPVEGVGLFRTELAFLDRADEPTVAEQVHLYREVIDAFAGHKVVIRTLDAGSDKPLKFVANAEEPNPAMGVRGNRIVETYPSIRNNQLDALEQAAQGEGRSVPWVMAPMIATVAEAREFAGQVRARGLIPGVMVEVPSAAILAEAILGEVDFVSIGTNDLTQYTMAADRMSPELASLTDPWQPAVLSLIAKVGEAGIALGKPVGVCGEAAADPLLACVLVGLGVTSLSAAPAAAAAVGLALGAVTLQQCQNAARGALNAISPAQAREAARAELG